MKFYGLALMALAATSSPALAQSLSESTSSGPRHDVGSFDIAGIQLGMSPDQVAGELQKRGFSGKFDKTRPNRFAQAVKAEAQRRSQAMPTGLATEGYSGLFATDAQGNRVMVEYIDTATGSEVASVTLHFNADTTDTSALPNDIAERYGFPSMIHRGSMVMEWCPSDETSCALNGSPTTANLEYGWFTGHKIKLSDGGMRYRANQQRISALFLAPTSDRQRSLLGN